MFRGFTVPWLIFVVLWAVFGLVHIEVSGTTPSLAWSKLGDHAYWIREVALPPLLILSAWIVFSLLGAYLDGRERPSR